MGYNIQACLGGLEDCKLRLASHIQSKINIQQAIDKSLVRFAEYRKGVEYFTDRKPDQDMRAVSESFFTTEMAELRRLFGLRNFYFGLVEETEHEKHAWEATYFDSL